MDDFAIEGKRKYLLKYELTSNSLRAVNEERVAAGWALSCALRVVAEESARPIFPLQTDRR
jgi:hypothetical protein